MAECSECHLAIQDAVVVRVGDATLHEDCLRCAVCRDTLDGSCFARFGLACDIHSLLSNHGPAFEQALLQHARPTPNLPTYCYGV